MSIWEFYRMLVRAGWTRHNKEIWVNRFYGIEMSNDTAKSFYCEVRK